MRTAGAVYRKLKEVKFRYLILLYRKYLKRSPENCKYNYPYQFIGGNGNPYEIRLCLCHQEDKGLPTDLKLVGIIPHLVDICEELKDCQNCNAFALRYNREDIKKFFEEQLSVKNIRESKYPDICALEWVLERSSVGITPMNKFRIILSKIQKILKLKNRSES